MKVLNTANSNSDNKNGEAKANGTTESKVKEDGRSPREASSNAIAKIELQGYFD